MDVIEAVEATVALEVIAVGAEATAILKVSVAKIHVINIITERDEVIP